MRSDVGSVLLGNALGTHHTLLAPAPGQINAVHAFASYGLSPFGGAGPLTAATVARNTQGQFEPRQGPVELVSREPGSTTGPLVVIPSPNARDYWLAMLYQGPGNAGVSSLKMLELKPSGLAGVSQLTHTVSLDLDGVGVSHTPLSVSPDGTLLAIGTANGALIVDVDARTGALTTERRLIAGRTARLAFSPDSSKLYAAASTAEGKQELVQVDLSKPELPSFSFGSFQRVLMEVGPDRKLYLMFNETMVSVIDRPNQAGLVAGLRQNVTDASVSCPFDGPMSRTFPSIISPFARLDALNVDADGDGIVDAEDADSDGDGIADVVENRGKALSTDRNSNGVPDYKDARVVACTDSAPADDVCDTLPKEYDDDGDGVPNHLDLDSDNDGIPDLWEMGQARLDVNRDGRIDTMVDTNQDGLDDRFDAKLRPTPLLGNLDSDQDGTLDAYDLDSDNDGGSDMLETEQADVNKDGRVDIAKGDLDRDGIVDALDVEDNGPPTAQLVDSDDDGIPDFQDALDNRAGPVPGEAEPARPTGNTPMTPDTVRGCTCSSTKDTRTNAAPLMTAALVLVWLRRNRKKARAS
jgi:hypothetical protein